MKTISNKTKTLFRTSFLILALIVGFTSCGSDDDGDDDGGSNDVSATIPAAELTGYVGTLTYTGPSGTIAVPSGAEANISGSAGNYTISFSDGVPSITGLDFELANGVFISQGSSNSVISIEDGELTVTFQDGGENWVFNGFNDGSDVEPGDGTVVSATIPSDDLTGYVGTLAYTGPNGTIAVPIGAEANISGSAGNYTISFSDGVPAITDLDFILENGVFITQGSDNSVVVIDEGDLTISVQIGGENWVFDGNNEETDDMTTSATIPSSDLTVYVGTLAYTAGNGDTIAVPDDAEATISGTVGDYTISFSDEVPSITGLDFELDNGVFIAQGGSNNVIRIEDGELTLNIQIGGENWVFDGEQ